MKQKLFIYSMLTLVLLTSCKQEKKKELLLNDLYFNNNLLLTYYNSYLYDVIKSSITKEWIIEGVEKIRNIGFQTDDVVFDLKGESIHVVDNIEKLYFPDTMKMKNLNRIDEIVPEFFYKERDSLFKNLFEYEMQLKQAMKEFKMGDEFLGYEMIEIWGDYKDTPNLTLREFNTRVELTSYSFRETIRNILLEVLYRTGVFDYDRSQMGVKYSPNCSSSDSLKPPVKMISTRVINRD